METRLAVLIGIDHYEKAPLKGCVKDALRMRDILESHADGAPNFDCRLFLSSEHGEEINRAFLRSKFVELFSKRADVALFYFAGHGALGRQGTGTLLATQELASHDQGVPVSELISMLVKSPAREKIVILDSCYAGGIGEMAFLDEVSVLPDNVAILVACRNTEVAAENAAGGLLTSLIVSALDGGAADVRGRVTIADVYTYASNVLTGWQQRPIFKANLTQLLSLRRCRPAVPAAVLWLLPELFPDPMAERKLSREYEPSFPEADPEKVAIFGYLQKLRDARMLVPSGGAAALYFAAQDSQSCALTPLGRYYWELAKARRIERD